MYLLCILFLTPVRRSRPSARSKAAELKDPPAATSSHKLGDKEAGVSQNSRLKELLSPSSSSSGLKPRPPSTPRVREPTSSSTGQTDGLTSRRKRREGHVGVRAASAKTDGDSASPKPRNHKEKTTAAGSRTVADQAPPTSTRSCSSVGRKTPQRKARSATPAPDLKRERGQRHLEHEQAARTIQRAWRR